MEHSAKALDSATLWNCCGDILNDILLSSFVNIYTICMVGGKNATNIPLFETLSKIPYVLFQLDNDSKMDSVDSSLLDGIESGCNAFVVHHAVILDFLDIYFEVHDEAGYRNPNKYVILLTDEVIPYSIRAHPTLREIINLFVLLVSHERFSIELISHRFVNLETGLEWYLVDQFHMKNCSLEPTKLKFSNKMDNLHGRSIRVATFNIHPHIIMQKKVSGEKILSVDLERSLDGLDGVLLIEFCRRCNCSIDLIIDPVNMWGEIQPNRTGNGIIGNLVERRADLGIGAISSWHLPRWKVILMVFSTSVHLAVLGTFCCTVVIHMFVVQFSIRTPLNRSIIWNGINVLAVLLLQATNNIRNRSVSETLLSVAVLLFGLNLASIYSGKYASLRTIPLHEAAIDTLEDLANSDVPWLQVHEAWSYSLLLSKNPTVMNLVSHFRVYPASQLMQLANEGGSAFAMGRLNNGHLMLGSWINAKNIHKYQLMRNDLYYEYEIAMATKTWPLIDRLNELFQRMASGLLLRAPEYRIIFEHDNYYVQTVALNSHEREPYEPKALAVDDMLGGLIALGSGLLCASIVFMIEICMIHKKVRGN